jgi:hypothetical protein
MDAIMKGACSLIKVNKLWNIPITSLLDHLNDKTRCMSKKVPCVLTKEEDANVVVLNLVYARM